jgi:hypothetical protein
MDPMHSILVMFFSNLHPRPQISRRSEQICGISATGRGCYGNAPETVILFSLMLKKRGKASDTCSTWCKQVHFAAPAQLT